MARDLEQEARNKALVLEAFDALFNRRDFEAAERYFSPEYVQHSVGIGRDATACSFSCAPSTGGTRVRWRSPRATM
jgi:predicted SnoaL-like aldol condensation-catalyzing enzyme